MHTGTLQVSTDIEIRWQGGHRNCKLDETQYFPNNRKKGLWSCCRVKLMGKETLTVSPEGLRASAPIV